MTRIFIATAIILPFFVLFCGLPMIWFNTTSSIAYIFVSALLGAIIGLVMAGKSMPRSQGATLGCFGGFIGMVVVFGFLLAIMYIYAVSTGIPVW